MGLKKLIAQCPYCESNNTMISDDVVFNGNIYFIRRCWACDQRFVEFNKVVPMSWMSHEEFQELDEQLWTSHTQRRNNHGSPGQADRDTE